MSYFLDKPEQFKISLTNVCNFRCIMCYNPTLKQKRGYIGDDLIFKILDECKEEEMRKVSLGSTGEPFLHKSFVKYLKYAKSLGLWTSTTSNCSVLTKELARSLIEEKLDRFNISIYSSSPEEHRKYTGTDGFYKVCENVKYFLNLWHETGSEMEVNMWFLQIPGVNDYEKYIELWGPLAKKVKLKLPLKELGNWAGQVDLFSTKPFSFKRDNNGTYLELRQKIPCPHIRYYLFILHNGDVMPCCNIPESNGLEEIQFGNIKDNSVMNIWKSEKYLLFKNDLYHKRAKNYRPCRNCSDIYRNLRIRLTLKDLSVRISRFVNSNIDRIAF